MRFLLVFFYVLYIVFYGLLSKSLLSGGLSSPLVLVLSGFVFLFICLLNALLKRHSLVPADLRIQAARLFTAGLGIVFGIFSYRYLHASTAVLINRLDLVLITIANIILLRQGSRVQLLQFCLIFLFFLGMIVWTKDPSEGNPGVLFAVLATACSVAGFLLTRSCAQTENLSVIAGIAAFGCILWGLGLFGTSGESFHPGEISWVQWSQLILLGVLNFIFYYLIVHLYRFYTIFSVQIFSFAGILALILLEKTVLHIVISWYFLGCTLLLLLFIIVSETFFRKVIA